MQRLLRRVRWIDAAITGVNTWRVLLTRRPVLVYSMPKTGSSSVTEAIDTQTDRGVIKTHYLGLATVRREIENYDLDRRPHFWWRSAAVGLLLRRRVGGPWKLICVVRDPVAQAVSHCFYKLRRVQIDDAAQRDLPARAAEVEAYLHRDWLAGDWFRDELATTTGIDVYASDFPTAQGWQRYRNGSFDVLVVRTEDLPRVSGEVLGTFLELPGPLSVPTTNTAPQGDTAYRWFAEQWEPEDGLLDAVYRSRPARHFYTPAELASFRSRWR